MAALLSSWLIRRGAHQCKWPSRPLDCGQRLQGQPGTVYCMCPHWAEVVSSAAATALSEWHGSCSRELASRDTIKQHAASRCSNISTLARPTLPNTTVQPAGLLALATADYSGFHCDSYNLVCGLAAQPAAPARHHRSRHAPISAPGSGGSRRGKGRRCCRTQGCCWPTARAAQLQPLLLLLLVAWLLSRPCQPRALTGSLQQAARRRGRGHARVRAAVCRWSLPLLAATSCGNTAHSLPASTTPLLQHCHAAALTCCYRCHHTLPPGSAMAIWQCHLAVPAQLTRVLLQRALGEHGLAPEFGGEEAVGGGQGVEGGLHKVACRWKGGGTCM